jgi:hypothetical protein
MNAWVRRSFTTTVAGVAIFALGTGPAAAHFCFKTEVQEQAAAGMAGSANWMRLGDLITMFTGVACEAGVAHVAAAGGATPDTLINGHGTMAGGTLKKGSGGGNKAISYLDFGGLEAAIPEAMELCAT